jgi:hypothetical protein
LEYPGAHIGSGNDLAAGRETAADTVIRLAGGENVLHAAFSGYKPLSAEAALAAAPDLILVTERNLEGLGGIDAVLGRAALAATPAGRDRRVIAMDGPLLLAFGPRLGAAVAALAEQLGTVSPGLRLVEDTGRGRGQAIAATTGIATVAAGSRHPAGPRMPAQAPAPPHAVVVR